MAFAFEHDNPQSLRKSGRDRDTCDAAAYDYNVDHFPVHVSTDSHHLPCADFYTRDIFFILEIFLSMTAALLTIPRATMR
jgi:hypothetical protein